MGAHGRQRTDDFVLRHLSLTVVVLFRQIEPGVLAKAVDLHSVLFFPLVKFLNEGSQKTSGDGFASTQRTS